MINLNAIQARLDGPVVEYSERQRRQDTVVLLAGMRTVEELLATWRGITASTTSKAQAMILTICSDQLSEALKAIPNE